ncbi:MAG TPA: nuclear transport factor 2 family protein [Actinomycetota bacterium]
MGEARELGERWFETVRGGDVDAIAALLTDDVDFTTPVEPISGPREAAAFVTGYSTAFPDSAFVIERWIEEGDMVVAEGRYTGTNTGPMVGPMGEMPATGKSVDLPFTTVMQVRDGKLAAQRAYWDNTTFMMQLGLMPGPGA